MPVSIPSASPSETSDTSASGASDASGASGAENADAANTDAENAEAQPGDGETGDADGAPPANRAERRAKKKSSVQPPNPGKIQPGRINSRGGGRSYSNRRSG
jgi:hypothetical protein